MKKLFTLLLAAAILFSFAACSPSGGNAPSGSAGQPPAGTDAPDEVYTIKIGHGYTADHPVNLAVQMMADQVKEQTGGRVVFEIYPNAELGNESVMSEMIQNGTLEMGVMSTSTISGFEKSVQIFDLPYLFADYDVAYAVLDGEAGEIVSQNMLDNANMRNLAYYENDYRSFSNNIKPITTPADLAGMKMRVPSMPMLTAWLEGIGCLPTTIAGNEIYSSLQQGIVDGQENGAIMTYLGGYYEVLKYFSMTNHVYGAAMVLINNDYWQTLPPDIQEALSQAAVASRDFEREKNASIRQECVDKMIEAGIEVNYLDEAQTAVFQESAKAVYPVIEETVGTELYTVVMEAVAAAEAE